MSRTVCGICWCPYDDDTGACACEPELKAQHMTDLRTAAQQALEAMHCAVPTGKITLTDWYKSITALRAALAEPVQECPNCASLQEQNTELDRKLAELQAAVLRSNGVDL